MSDSQRPDDPSDLQERFAELKRRDEGRAPDFDRTWEVARASAGRRVSSTRRGRTVLLVGAGLAAAAALVLVILPSPGPSSSPADAPVAMGVISVWPAAPLDFLLEPPAHAAIDVDFGVDTFRYRLDQVLEDAQSGAVQ